MRDFYLTLPSDSSLNTFRTNKQSDFVVKLDHPIYIDRDAWEVALVEITTPSQMMNISVENNYFFLTFLDQRILNRGEVSVTEMCEIENKCGKYKLVITADNYTTLHHLAEEMQLSIDAFENGFLRQASAYIHISYSETSNKRRLDCYSLKHLGNY